MAGVYRQSLNFEDYIGSNSSSHWTPPPNQQRVNQSRFRKFIRKLPCNNPHLLIICSSIRMIANYRELDTSTSSSSAIANKLHVNDKITPSSRCIETPPEPSYSPPKPPVRRAKSTLKSKVTEIDKEHISKRLEETRSEVTNNDTISATESRAPISPAPRTTGIKYNQSHSPTETNPSDLWKKEQPEFSSEILKETNGKLRWLCY